MMATNHATALRELLLAAESAKQVLDASIRVFARALRLPQLDLDEEDDDTQTEDDALSLCARFLEIHPQGELLMRVWPDQIGAGSRWAQRESLAVFLQVVTHLLRVQQSRDAAQAEAFALRIVREKCAHLEKALTWSDKPLIEFRALELLGALAGVSGAVARELVRLFNFQCPAFVKMATRRMKKAEIVAEEAGSEEEQQTTRQPPFQLREAYVDLVLTLVECPDKSVHRFATKEGGVAASLFKSVDGDSSELLTKLFTRLGERVLHNPEVEHKNKLVVFNGTCVHQLLALLQIEDDERVRDTALGVLNALFFEHAALYVVPERQALRLFLSKATTSSASQGDELPTTSEQAYAVKVIRNAVITIGVNELLASTQAQTLVTTFLAKYPGLLAEYLGALAVQLEPKPVYRWFCVASMVQKLLACSLDAVAVGLPTISTGSRNTSPSWGSAQSLAARLIAPGNFRKELSRGIQHGNNLVVYSSLGVIEATLQRYVRLAPSLEAGTIASEVQAELRFLLPSPEALVSLLLKLCVSEQRSVALIYVRALTVFRLYLECLPQAMREVKVDFTKTLAWRYLDGPGGDSSEAAMPKPMQSLIVGEMLRFLLAVDASRLRFLFAAGGATNRSKLLQLLLLYVSTPSRAVQELASQVLQRSLLASGIFGREVQHEHGAGGRAAEEIAFWLESLRQAGTASCAQFLEQLVQNVMIDPFVYVAMGNRAATESSVISLSPTTIALVAFLNSHSQTAAASRGPAKPDVSTYRADSSVVAFAVRVLMSLLPTSEGPRQLIALIANAGNVDEAAMEPQQDEQDEQDEVLSDSSSTKKRKRSMGSEVIGRADNVIYAWLKAHCEALVSGERGADVMTKQKKKARATGGKWHRYNDARALTAAIADVSPAEFAACWEEIVANCAEVMESFAPVHYYLSARGDVDVLSLLLSSSAVSTEKKPKKAKKATSTHGSTPTEAFVATLPMSIVLQHMLFQLAGQQPQQQKSVIATVIDLVKRRLSESTLSAVEATRMCEQLLFFFLSSSHRYCSVGENARLCELLLLLLTIILVSSNETAPASVSLAVARIFRKLRALVVSESSESQGTNGLLWRKLAAVELSALRLNSSNVTGTELTSLSGLLQRSGVALVALLASRIAPNVRIALLDRLLQHRISPTSKSPRMVLVERVLKSLGGCSDLSHQHYDSFADYKRSKLLARKLWQLLESHSGNRDASFFAAGFTVLSQVGGVDVATAQPAIGKSLVPLVMKAATDSDAAKWRSADMLRCIVTAIRCWNGEATFVTAFEKQLLERLQPEKDEWVRCELVEAVYSVFARIESPELREFAEKRAAGCYQRVLLPSQESRATELALLRHLATDTNVASDATFSIDTIMSKLAADKRLSSTQLLGLLLLMRNNGSSNGVNSDLLPIIIRSGLHAMEEELKGDQGTASERGENRRHQFAAIALVAEGLVASVNNQKEASASSDAVLPLFTEAREVFETSGANFPVFDAFMSLSIVLLRVVEDDASTSDYDFDAHLDAIVQHPCFAQSLQSADNDVARLSIVRVIARFARITGKYTRSLLQTLLSAYSMSLSPFDRSLRVLFEDFETRAPAGANLSLASMGFRFGASSTASPSTAISSSSRSHHDLVDDSAWLLGGGLEPSRIRATVEFFPLERVVSTANDAALLDLDGELSVENEGELEQTVALKGGNEAAAYDPAFLLPMLAHFISSSDLPDAAIVQQGLLGVALRGTSSSADSIRVYAYGILAHLHESLEAAAEAAADFKAGRQVHLLLDVFRRAVEHPLQQVPSVVTVFLNDVLSVLTRPAHVLYPQVNHFLLARPALDLGDVPMFYSLFNSRAPLTFRQERSWLLHALRRGVRHDIDVALLVRRHVLPMLLSFFTSELADTHTQPLITRILLTTLQTPAGGLYLLTKAALLEWLTTQFVRQGAAAAARSVDSSDKKSAASIPVTSTTLLLPLMTLLETALQATAWDELDAVQHHATALQAVNAFAALWTATIQRRSSSMSGRAITMQLAAVAQLVVRRAGSICSLLVLGHTLEAVQRATELPHDLLADDELKKQQKSRCEANVANARALDCAETVAGSLSRWLLLCRHAEAQKRRFPDWATVLRQVAAILASCLANTATPFAQNGAATSLAHQQRARLALEQLKTVLDQIPTLKQLVLAPPAADASSTISIGSTYGPTLL